ncbi:hypothetical protein IHE45_17G082000 [Dioscorea alata]|uniref:Uncharacterized protein n=1 Tax=Dioscorea alata TaxID=55571 RepID=A0ACB7UDD4_DIOAL|nr:hypothetical protein IHE45_17G082000 [Dioscorea alata]
MKGVFVVRIKQRVQRGSKSKKRRRVKQGHFGMESGIRQGSWYTIV